MKNIAVQRDYEVEARPAVKQKTEVRIMRGIGASRGIAVGPCRVISRPEDLRGIKTGEILVFRTASPDLSIYIGRLRGLVTEAGGRLTIAAHYARENEVPHVAGVSDVMAAVTDGQIIRIDGTKGTVSLI